MTEFYKTKYLPRQKKIKSEKHPCIIFPNFKHLKYLSTYNKINNSVFNIL